MTAAVQLAVHDITNSSSQSNISPPEPVAVALIAELVLDKVERVAKDLEAFAVHAKRSTINSEDVKLVARNNPRLKEQLTRLAPDRSNVKKSRPVDASCNQQTK